jgi:hypothetical protein
MILLAVLVIAVVVTHLMFNIWLHRARNGARSPFLNKYFTAVWVISLAYLVNNLAYVGWSVGSELWTSSFYDKGLDAMMDILAVLGGLVGTFISGIFIMRSIQNIRKAAAETVQ